MSVIKLKCIEQTLTIVNSPTISSGNVNYDQVNFTFCDTWSGFTKTAIFYRNENEVYEKILNSAGTCTIPKEVLKTKGIFFIGVFGVKDNVVITSQVISYRVNQGAITENLMPPDPTPDIYAQILAEFGDVRDVYEDFKKTLVEMDNTIVVSHDYEYPNSKPGGLKVNYIEGASVQNGEPSPSNPIAIENVGDCVEMMQGQYVTATGVYDANKYYVCTKRKIPCKQNDNIRVEIEQQARLMGIVFYDKDNKYLTGLNYSEKTIAEATVPSGASYFVFNVNININREWTPENVGKITLTVNGKYVGQIVEHGKNLFDVSKRLVGSFENGDLKITGSTAKVYGYQFKENTQYTFSAWLKNADTTGNVDFAIRYTDGTYVNNVLQNRTTEYKYVTYTSEAGKTISEFKVHYDYYTGYAYIKNGELQIEEGSEATPYEPYTEKVATIFLDEPLREGDRLVKVDGVWNVERKRAAVDIGILDWEKTTQNRFLCKGVRNIVKKCVDSIIANAVCSKYILDTANNVYQNILINTLSIDSSGHIMIYDQKHDNYTDGISFKNAITNTILEYELATPTLTPLDLESQKALNGLETFKDMTYLEVDNKIKPSGIEVEYGVTRDAGYTLKSLLNTESNAIKIDNAISAMLALSQG
jgi:hypothetical protein